MSYHVAKGHGTKNDFVLLPDPDGAVHGALPADRVAALCDRRAGIGGDGVIRVIRSVALAAHEPGIAEAAAGAEWFMDYRNTDGSVSEMCGNGARVLARFLAAHHHVDFPLALGTRAGVRTVTREGEQFTVDMGPVRSHGTTTITVADGSGSGSGSGAGRVREAAHLDLGNPHAVVLVEDLAEAGSLVIAPEHDATVYPDGVNVEFVARRGERHVAMRVHERGSGETWSCGTGACAAVVAAALADRAGSVGAEGELGPPTETTAYRLDVPGGQLTVTWQPDGHALLTGPAVLVAEGTATL